MVFPATLKSKLGEIHQELDVLNSSQKKPSSIIILIHPRVKHSGIVSQPLECWHRQGKPFPPLFCLDGVLWNTIKVRTRKWSQGKAGGGELEEVPKLVVH